MADTINFQPGTTVGEIIIVDGKSWIWDGKKWVLSDSFTSVSAEFVKKEGDTMTGDLLLQDVDGDPAEYTDLTDPSTAVNKKYVDESFLTDTTRDVFFNNPDVDAYKMTYMHNTLNDQDFDTTISLNSFEHPSLNDGNSITQCHNKTGLGYHCVHEEYLEKVLTHQVYVEITKQGTFKLDFNGKQPGRSAYDQTPPAGAVWHYSGVAVVPGEANRLLINGTNDLDGYCVKRDGTANVSYADADRCNLSGQVEHFDHEFTDVPGGTYIRGTLKKVENPNVDGGYHHALIKDPTSPVFFSPVKSSSSAGQVPKLYSVAMRGSGPYKITYLTEKYATKNELIELEEEIEALAPTTERGIWKVRLDDDLTTGQFYMKSGGNFNVNYEDSLIDFIAISRTDRNSVSHGFTRDEVGDLIQILNQNDNSYGLLEIVDKDDSDPDMVTFGVEWVQGIGSTGDYEEARIKIFQAPQGGAADSPQLLPTVRTTDPLRLKSDDGTSTPNFGDEKFSAVGRGSGNYRCQIKDTEYLYIGKEIMDKTVFSGGRDKYVFVPGQMIMLGDVHQQSSAHPIPEGSAVFIALKLIEEPSYYKFQVLGIPREGKTNYDTVHTMQFVFHFGCFWEKVVVV